MKTENSIWCDTDCTLEDEEEVETFAKPLNTTFEFRNTLITNKGDIHSAKKLTLTCSDDDLVEIDFEESSLFSLSESNDSEDSLSLSNFSD